MTKPPAPGQPTLDLTVQHSIGRLALDIHFTLVHPWTILFAPSGAGKSTILRIIAGLERPRSAIVTLSADRITDTAAGIHIPPHQRHVGLVAQRPALFPHLSVLRNITYGMRGHARDLEPILQLCRVTHLRALMPSRLSGGERQRVALARTLAASNTRLLLLDEPFTGLEADLRDELIHDLRIWTVQQAMPVLMVTHDLGEVFAADAQVLRMADGRITASGKPAEVLEHERLQLLKRLGHTS